MADVELRDQLITLLEAGHETTATALAWAFERLSRNRGPYERLTEEIRGEDEGTEYLEAAIKETLRIRTVVIDTIRKLDRRLSIGRYEVPAGWLAGPATALIHRLPEHFEDPTEFKPERFTGEDASYQAWFPFGGGRRRCVGSNLAQLEMAAVIEQVLRRFDLGATGDPHGERPKIQHVTLVPAEGAYLELAPVEDPSA